MTVRTPGSGAGVAEEVRLVVSGFVGEIRAVGSAAGVVGMVGAETMADGSGVAIVSVSVELCSSGFSVYDTLELPVRELSSLRYTERVLYESLPPRCA